jgi:hypothetical protein
MKNIADAIFFILEVCTAMRPKPPFILHCFRLRENISGCRFFEAAGCGKK